MKKEEPQDFRQALIDNLKKVIAVDLAKLERDGVISRIGKSSWYRVPNLNALPRDSGLLADAIAQDSKGVKIRIRKNLQEASAKLLKQVTRKK